MKGILIVAFLFIVLSSYFIYLSIKQWKYILRFEKLAIKTSGEIIEIYHFHKKGDETNTAMMKVKYYGINDIEVINDFILDLFERKVGDIVPIYYSKYNSNESMTDITNYPILFIGLSSLLLIAGLIIFYINF
jgi:hypothetical protein